MFDILFLFTFHRALNKNLGVCIMGIKIVPSDHFEGAVAVIEDPHLTQVYDVETPG